MKKKAIYPGTFDPITNGHIDIISRAALIFNKVIIGVAVNATKKTLFSHEERIELVKQVVAHLVNVEVLGFSGLLINFAHKNQSNVLVRGLRGISDFEYEQKMAQMNLHLSPNLESVFFISSKKYSFISSTLIKEVLNHGGDVQSFLPKMVYLAIQKKFI